ncbi:hypothetical protein [Bacillus sp. V3-13]|uniref:hypothetical protein n=1 Tax=Bacillus sp. V3-13 TaxID=2053728 RepID=UPI0015E13670|nr:hypothetical protein [Bacillus sp. V3-13]
MTFKKGFLWGYLVFVLAMVMVYFTVPREYVFYAFVTLPILFAIYQSFLILKIKKARKG